MINERKIRLMTRLAIYEKREGKHAIPMTRYFKEDYVGWNVLKTILWITVAYFIGAAVWFLYNSEEIVENIAALNYFAIIRYAVMLYVVLIAAYGVYAYVMYSARYRKAMKGIAVYEKGLKYLAKMHMEESRKNELTEGTRKAKPEEGTNKAEALEGTRRIELEEVIRKAESVGETRKEVNRKAESVGETRKEVNRKAEPVGETRKIEPVEGDKK